MGPRRVFGGVGRHMLRPSLMGSLSPLYSLPQKTAAVGAAPPVRHLAKMSGDTPAETAPSSVVGTEKGRAAAAGQARQTLKSTADRPEPFVLQLLPGRTPVRKAATVAMTAAACVAAVRTGVYVPSDETIALAAFVLVVRSLHVLLRKPFVAAARAYIDGLYDAIVSRREDAQRDVVLGVARLKSYADAASVASAVFALRRAIPGMEAALGDAKRHAQAVEGVRARLDAAVRAADERRRAAALARHAALVRALHERLSDPNVQTRILSDAIKSLARAQPMP